MSVWCIYLNLCNILNGMIKRSTDCSINLIFIRLASQLYYFELKNIYMPKYFYLDSDTKYDQKSLQWQNSPGTGAI